MAWTLGMKLALGAVVALTLALGLGIALAGPPVRITVEEPSGADVKVAVPAFVVGLALWAVPDAALAEGLDEVRPWLEIARDAARTLEKAGNVTLVRIVGQGERVTIGTEDGVLVVDIVDGGETVRIEMPLRTVDRIVRRLERAAERTAVRAARAAKAGPAVATGRVDAAAGASM